MIAWNQGFVFPLLPAVVSVPHVAFNYVLIYASC